MKMLNLLHLEQKIGLKQMINLHGTYDTNSIKVKIAKLQRHIRTCKDSYNSC